MTAMAWDYIRSFDEVREKERDGVEVAIGPVFVATLENIALNAFGSGNGNEDI